MRLTPASRRGAPRVAAPGLDLGLVLAERFKIARFIARGGMGEVYEALDLELGEPVALKTIRPDIAEDPMALARFKREIQLARRVTHPNVSRMFDIFRHRWPEVPEGEAEDLTFLTMELLAGETLHERLRRDGPMAPRDALGIVEQITAALGAAHAASVVHRDFKSANVMLVPGKGPNDPVRAVVTDFGLAHGGAGGGSMAMTQLTNVGDALGTPDYMAPEQVTGGTITEAADIYAFGIVMYEMVTGHLPFASDSPLTTAVKRLSEAPPSPRLHVADLDPKWDAAILRCLERDPADRFSSASEVLKALAGEDVVAGKREREAHERQQRRLLTLGAGAAAFLVVAFLGVRYLLLLRPQPAGTAAGSAAPIAPAVKARRGVAVLGFKNQSGRQETAWISTALSEMLTTELGVGEKLQTTSGDTVARVRMDLGLSDTDSYARDVLARLRTNLGADLIVVGSYVVSGGKLRLDLRLLETASGATVATVTETTGEAELIDLVARVSGQLRDKLGLGALSAAEAQSVQAVLPADPEAARLYSEGLAKLRLFDALAAKGLLERAVAVDANHSLAHSALAATWLALGYDGSARLEAKKAFDLSANLPREDRYVVEGRYHEAAREWDQAADTYRKLFGFFPDNLEYGLRLANVQTLGGKGHDALDTLDLLRKLPAPARDDPRIDFAEAEAAKALSDFRRERLAAWNASTKATKQGARLLVGAARLDEGWAYRNLGQLAEAAAAIEDAKSIFIAAGDRGGVARAVNYQGLLLKNQGYLDQAREMFLQALTVRRTIGDMSGVAASTNNIATILWQRGQLADARTQFTQALDIYRQIGHRTGVAQTLQNLANVSASQGDSAAARQQYDEALAAYREVGDKSGEASTLNNVAGLLLSQGDAAGARQMFEDALKMHREIGEKAGVANALNNLGHVLQKLGDYPGAATRLDEALTAYRDLKDQDGVARALTNSGMGLLHQGRLADAKKAFTDALAAGPAKALALAVQPRLGQVLLLQGDLAAARTAYQQALDGWQQIGEKQAAAEISVALARVSLEEGRPADAETAARAGADDAVRQKRYENAAQALDVLGRALLAQGKTSDASKTLARTDTLPLAALAPETQMALKMTRARAAATTGKVGEATTTLEATLAQATSSGAVPLQFEARLALGEIEMRAPNAAAGAAHLQALEKDASAKGYGLIARKAAGARQSVK